MRGILLLAAVAVAVAVGAEDRVRDRGVRPEVFIPIDPNPPPMQYFGRGDHHVVPGTVTINRAPYRCDLDKRTFTDREAFVAHLRTSHRVATEDIPDRLVVLDGVVHFVLP
jgi:hypothetical protein